MTGKMTVHEGGRNYVHGRLIWQQDLHRLKKLIQVEWMGWGWGQAYIMSDKAEQEMGERSQFEGMWE